MTNQTPLIDIETLLAPISDAEPAGSSLRYEGTYDRVREARREDDPTLPMGEWETKLKVSDFALVDRLCREALQKKSKDLQLAAWLTEALLVRSRIRGIAAGLSLTAALCERYWEQMFPVLGDEGDPASRVAIVEWMDEGLSDRLRRTPFADGGEASSFSLLDWDKAGQPQPVDGASGEAQPPQTRASILARISLSGASPWTALVRDAEEAMAQASELERVLAAHIALPPSMRRVRQMLGQIADLARDGARVNGEEVPSAADADDQGGAQPGLSGASGGRSAQSTATFSGTITSRAEAYFRLAEAAEYLLRTEPHSPVPYLVKRAVQWGNMSLAELLYELVASPDDMVAIQRLLGMRGREE